MGGSGPPNPWSYKNCICLSPLSHMSARVIIFFTTPNRNPSGWFIAFLHLDQHNIEICYIVCHQFLEVVFSGDRKVWIQTQTYRQQPLLFRGSNSAVSELEDSAVLPIWLPPLLNPVSCIGMLPENSLSSPQSNVLHCTPIQLMSSLCQRSWLSSDWMKNLK